MAENITKRNADVVFCIDGTGSMVPVIENVKEGAVRFHQDLINALVDIGSDIDSVRVRVIVFRDYEDDGKDSMVESPFFELPLDNDLFRSWLDGITASGGGDAPENGLESLYYAFKSDWNVGAKDRQVTVLFTDADALPLKSRASSPDYPEDMVDLDGLINVWNCAVQDPSIKLQKRNKRLVIVAPKGTFYEELAGMLPGSIFKAVESGRGLNDVDFNEIVKLVAASVGR